MTIESRDDMLGRLDLMQAGDDKWDLSINDRAAIREALADMRRLDWWEKQRIYTMAPVMDAAGWRLHEARELRPLNVPFARTLRGAIDAAMSAASPPPTRDRV